MAVIFGIPECVQEDLLLVGAVLLLQTMSVLGSLKIRVECHYKTTLATFGNVALHHGYHSKNNATGETIDWLFNYHRSCGEDFRKFEFSP